MNMEFLTQNLLNTTTQLTVNSNTDRSLYLFDRTPTKQYYTSGLNDDTTACSIDITFSATETVDRIVLQNINWKSFKIYHNGNAANLFSLASGNITGTSEFTQNSVTNLFLHLVSTTAVTSVSFRVTTTMAANEEKKVGQIWINGKTYSLDRNPAASGYQPQIYAKQVQHEMADGGMVVVDFASKFRADIELGYRNASETSELKELFDAKTFVFVPYPTGTSWANEIYEVNWVGPWDFVQPAKDYYQDHGWKGTLRLMETPL